MAIKNHHRKGDGKRRDKSRLDQKGALAHASETSGHRGKARSPALQRVIDNAQDRHRTIEAKRVTADETAARAAAAPKARRRAAKSYLEFQAARQEQDRRYENTVGGGHGVGDEKSQEFRDYFGVGDSTGKRVEERVTYRKFLADRKPSADEAHAAESYHAGRKLGIKHGRAGSAPTDDAEYDDASRGMSDDDFAGGYSDGAASVQRSVDDLKSDARDPNTATGRLAVAELQRRGYKLVDGVWHSPGKA